MSSSAFNSECKYTLFFSELFGLNKIINIFLEFLLIFQEKLGFKDSGAAFPSKPLKRTTFAPP